MPRLRRGLCTKGYPGGPTPVERCANYATKKAPWWGRGVPGAMGVGGQPYPCNDPAPGPVAATNR